MILSHPKVQNNTLIKMRINYGLSMSPLEGDGIPLALLYRANVTYASWHANV
jgi:hypothetical protein